jgi:hypothetical protein
MTISFFQQSGAAQAQLELREAPRKRVSNDVFGKQPMDKRDLDYINPKSQAQHGLHE